MILGGAGGSLEPAENAEYPIMDTIINKNHFGIFEVDGQEIRLRVEGIDGEAMDEVNVFKSENQLTDLSSFLNIAWNSLTSGLKLNDLKLLLRR